MAPKLDSPADLGRRVSKLTSILDIAKALAAARGLDELLELVVKEAGKVVDADRVTLFVLDREKNELWSRVAHGGAQNLRVPLGSGIAGLVAATGEALRIEDAYQDARFNRTFDKATGYRTHSILCVPMRDAQGEVTGVIQALNKKDEAAFDEEDTELLLALGGQAAGAIENALLHEEISHLFEGFVGAAVVAIEARDPTTAGHSGRVAELTLGLAKALEATSEGRYRGTYFSQQDIQEMRYASLLHDFGKVGVREHVLVKAEKLYPQELEVLQARFQVARKDAEVQSFRRRLARVQSEGERALARIDEEEETRLQQSLRELDEVMEFVLSCNKPSVLARDGFERLAELGKLQFADSRGAVKALLEPREIERLSIPKGSLSADERKEIESHVTHTFRFLSQIPWTRALKRVPEIAYAHHEKIGGAGYPRSLRSEAIPLQSKMMAVSDVYDALTASDRPYKKAVPHALALDILHKEVQAGSLDGELLQVFIAAEVPAKSLASPPK